MGRVRMRSACIILHLLYSTVSPYAKSHGGGYNKRDKYKSPTEIQVMSVMLRMMRGKKVRVFRVQSRVLRGRDRGSYRVK